MYVFPSTCQISRPDGLFSTVTIFPTLIEAGRFAESSTVPFIEEGRFAELSTVSLFEERLFAVSSVYCFRVVIVFPADFFAIAACLVLA